MDIKVLVAVEDYPGGGSKVTHQFVHVRNLYYLRAGLEVTVLNFKATRDYYFEGVKVISYKSYLKCPDGYDCLVAHQANLKHHARFLLKHGNRFLHFIFFFHGHEVLRVNSVYPKPYSYLKKSCLAHRVFQDVYDSVKFAFWKRYLPSVKSKSDYIFVSKWMLDEFEKWLDIRCDTCGMNAVIIPNCISREFENNFYYSKSDKIYDFITIRGNIDTSKYAVDLVLQSAEANPWARYLVVGKGAFFRHFKKPDNVSWLDTTLSHAEIIDYLNMSKCALMPTRTDAQGLMMCEMASFGIPTITSDIPVCREVLSCFSNVAFISNQYFGSDLRETLASLQPLSTRNPAFFADNTIGQEVELIQKYKDFACS